MLFMSPSCSRGRGNWVRVSLLIQRNSHEPLVSPAEIDPERALMTDCFQASESRSPRPKRRALRTRSDRRQPHPRTATLESRSRTDGRTKEDARVIAPWAAHDGLIKSQMTDALSGSLLLFLSKRLDSCGCRELRFRRAVSGWHHHYPADESQPESRDSQCDCGAFARTCTERVSPRLLTSSSATDTRVHAHAGSRSSPSPPGVRC